MTKSTELSGVGTGVEVSQSKPEIKKRSLNYNEAPFVTG